MMFNSEKCNVVQEIVLVSKLYVLTLKVPEKLQLYGLNVYYVVHICDFGMLRVKRTSTQVVIPPAFYLAF